MIEHPLKRAHFFSWGKSCKDGIKTSFLAIFHVPIDVPQVPNVFPIASHFYPTHMFCPKFSLLQLYRVGSKERARHRNFRFGEPSKFQLSLLKDDILACVET
jgi:hypothetical protein